MAMTSGNSGGIQTDINVTPLIDVLLVLLIVFMLIVPMVPKGLDATAPQPTNIDQIDQSKAIVVSVLHKAQAHLEYRINQDVVSKSDLFNRLTAIYANRADRTMFIKGDDNVDFSRIAEVIDVGHTAGVDHIGLITPKVALGL